MALPELTRRAAIGLVNTLFPAARAVDSLPGVSADTFLGGARASAVAFLQRGAGALVRSIESKARDTVSVLDFGARGDGVTDDTAAFDAAIATGRTVWVPYTEAGYAVHDIRVVDNMQVVGEKAGLALAPILIVTQSGAAAFRNAGAASVYHCVFENLACRAAPGVTGASFYAQATRASYAAYFTFRQVETYRNLRTSYTGVFIFALWDRCRDGYLGPDSDREHAGIVALAGAYGQPNQQNVNRIRDSMFFGAFGAEGAIVASYGVLWTVENTDFEMLRTRAFAAYNIVQLRFSDCWFESITAPAIVHAGNYPGVPAGSGVALDHCMVVLTGTAPRVVTVDAPGTVSARDTLFNLVGAGVRFCDSAEQVRVNENNVAASGPGAADFFTGSHHDGYTDGRRYLNGAADNGVAAMTLQNEGGIAATQGLMSRAGIAVGATFVTVATSQTGLGGTCVVSGRAGNDGAQFRMIKDWQGETVRDVVAPLNTTGRALAFRIIDNDLQMRVDAGTLTVFTTMLH